MSHYEAILGTTPFVSLGITLVLAGGCAAMTGRVLALNWRPDWQIVAYGLLLAVADRFLIFALFQGELLSLSGYLADAAFLILVAAFSFRLTRARQMVRQYPWACRRRGLIGWEEIDD
jgi:branched-chain amino acid transport system ATP-binding protein